jgi:hypothetical protein
MKRERYVVLIAIGMMAAMMISMATAVAAEKVSQDKLKQECKEKFDAQALADNNAWCYPDWKTYKDCAYSGCWDEIVKDNWMCSCYSTDMVYVSGYIECVDRAMDNHLECLKKANEKQRSIAKNNGKFKPSFWQWRGDRKDECIDKASSEIRACKERACTAYCIDKGASGGKLAGSSCFGWCECDEIPKETNKPPVAHASVASESRPELEPGSHISVEYGERVIFSAAESYDSDGEIDLYTWHWSDTQMALGEVTQRRYLPIGKNVVTLEVQDNKGAKSTDTVVVTVTEKAKGKLMLRVRHPFRSTYGIGDEVGIVFDVTNVGTVDVECRTDYFVVDPFGDLVSEINSGLPNIAAGKEHQWAPLKWQIPSTAKTGEYTIEAFLVWSSGSADAVASFTVTETAVKEATKPPAVSTTPIEEMIEESTVKEYPLSNAECNSNYRACEGIDFIVVKTTELKNAGATDIHIAKFVNGVVDRRITSLNNFWKDPFTFLGQRSFWRHHEFDDWRDFHDTTYDTTAIWAWNNEMGNCEEFGSIVYYILKNSGIKCAICGQEEGCHAFIVMNWDKTISLTDSRTWPKNVFVIDSWQGKVFNGNDAYKNKYIMNNGKSGIRIDTKRFSPNVHYGCPENINDRNLVWDTESKQWKCREGYVKKYTGQAFQGFCVPKK